MIAYSDASMLGRHRAALGVLIGGVPHSRTMPVMNLQHAELSAVSLAVELAPAGQTLNLHVDCQTTAYCLKHPKSAPERLLDLSQSISELLYERRLNLVVSLIPRGQNLAHKVAYQAARQAPQVGRQEVTHRLQFTRKGEDFEIHGLGLTRITPHLGQPTVRLLTILAPYLPPEVYIHIRGLGLLASSMWKNPALADPETARLIIAAKTMLLAQRTTLHFK